MTSESIREYVVRAKSGDQRAFEELVNGFQAALFGIAYSITGDALSSEDIVQDAFLACWQHLDRLHTPEGFPLWIRKTTRNLACNWVRSSIYRRRLIERRELLEKTAPHVPSADEPMAHSEGLRRIGDALQKLPESVREAVVVYYLQGKSASEAAEMLGTSEQAMRQRLKRGRDQLRAYFVERWEREFDEELSDLVPRRVLKQFSAALALGVVWSKVAHAATRTGPSMAIHRLLRERLLLNDAIVLRRLIDAAELRPYLIWAFPLALLIAAMGLLSLIPQETEIPSSPSTKQHVIPPAAPDVAEAGSLPSGSKQKPLEAQTSPPPKGHTISGRVFDISGAPIEGVKVTVYAGSYIPSDILCHVCLSLVARQAPTYEAISDKEGRYSVSSIECDHDVLMTAGAEGLATGLLERVPLDADHVDFQLADAMEFYGKVVDALTGSTIPEFEAKVACIYTDPSQPHMCQGSDYRFQLFLTEDGLFTLDTDRYESVSVAVRAIGYADYESDLVRIDSASEAAPYTIALKPGRTITGFVKDDQGQPVSLAMVTKVNEKATPAFTRETTGHTCAFTDEQGGFELTGIADEDPLNFVAAWHKEYAPGFAPNPPLGEEAVIQLQKAGAIQGRIHRGDRPCSSWWVRVRLPVGHPYRIHSTSAFMDPSGCFSVGGLPPGLNTVEVIDRLNDVMVAAEPIEVRPGSMEEFDLDVNLLGSIHGTVQGLEEYEDPHLSLRRNGILNYFFHIPLVSAGDFLVTAGESGTYELIVYEHEDPLNPILSCPVQIPRGHRLELNLQLPATTNGP